MHSKILMLTWKDLTQNNTLPCKQHFLITWTRLNSQLKWAMVKLSYAESCAELSRICWFIFLLILKWEIIFAALPRVIAVGVTSYNVLWCSGAEEASDWTHCGLITVSCKSGQRYPLCSATFSTFCSRPVPSREPAFFISFSTFFESLALMLLLPHQMDAKQIALSKTDLWKMCNILLQTLTDIEASSRSTLVFVHFCGQPQWTPR